MNQVVPDVYLIEGLRSANVYALVSDGWLTLVDSGLKNEADKIAGQLQEGGFALSKVRNIVLTHAHGDHTGSAAELAKRSGANVMAHESDADFIEQTRRMPSPPGLMRLVNWLSGSFFKSKPCRVDRRLVEGDTLRALSSWQVLHTPGHTPGSICLYESQQRILICGDTLFHKNPMTGKAGLQPSLSFLTLDKAQLRDSLRKLSALPVDVICFGHGEVLVMKDAQKQIEALLEGE
jgi:glyoxylase-like metal-dependent hydrolase (beta-lactamase superfamily II)